MIKKIILFFALLSCVGIVSAETVQLKSGKSYRGKIVERNNQFIKMDVNDVVVTFYADEINTVTADTVSHGASSVSSSPNPFNLPRLTQPINIAVTQPLPAEPVPASGHDEVIETPAGEAQPDIQSSLSQYSFSSNKHFLWKATSGSSIVYLLGSMHMAKPEIYPLPEVIEAAFAGSNTLIVEVDVARVDQLQLQRLMMEKGMYQGNDTLDKHLSKQTYALLGKKMSEMGADIDTFRAFKPWYVGLQLTVFHILRLGYDPNLGLDMHFLQRAGNKKIVELESFDFQINLLSGFSDKLQELFIISSIEEINMLEEMLDRLTDLWLNGDADGMEEILFSERKKKPELQPVFDELFTNRNLSMTAKIERFLSSSGTYFVVVGAGHLVGEQGIIQLLQDKGYTVSQM